jgi:hypothetical protein
MLAPHDTQCKGTGRFCHKICARMRDRAISGENHHVRVQHDTL